MLCSKRKTDLIGRNIGAIQNHCTILFVIIFIALKVNCIRIGFKIIAMGIFSSTKLRQFGILLLWFVILNPQNKSFLVLIVFN